MVHSWTTTAAIASSGSHHQMIRTNVQIRTTAQAVAPAASPITTPNSKDKMGRIADEATSMVSAPAPRNANVKAVRALTACGTVYPAFDDRDRSQ